jgi:thiol-disulfide isomerase/thioredoxin
VTSRFAPEVRGTLARRSEDWRLKAVAALGCAVVVFCFVVPPLGVQTSANQLRPWTAGRRPTFSFPTTGGANIALGAARGHVGLMHFFATWCDFCRDELPALNRLEARANGKVTLLGIAIAGADQRVQRFFAATPVNFAVLLDRDRAFGKALKGAALPTTFVLDASLRRRLVIETAFAWDTLDPGKLIGSSALKVGGAIRDASNR